MRSKQYNIWVKQNVEFFLGGRHYINLKPVNKSYDIFSKYSRVKLAQ